MFGIVNSIRIMFDRILVRTKPMGSMNQIHWGFEHASDVFAEALIHSKPTGKTLWESLPHEMAPVVIRTWFDPYDKTMTKADLRDWLWAHVIFDGDGNIVAIHDRGEIFACAEAWAVEVGWFSRANTHREDHWIKADKERATYG